MSFFLKIAPFLLFYEKLAMFTDKSRNFINKNVKKPLLWQNREVPHVVGFPSPEEGGAHVEGS